MNIPIEYVNNNPYKTDIVSRRKTVSFVKGTKPPLGKCMQWKDPIYKGGRLQECVEDSRNM